MGLIKKLTSIADAIRTKTGSTDPLTLDEMAEQIADLEGEEAQTYILVDEDGNEMAAVLVDEEVTLTATANDIRAGTTAVTGAGVITGEKEIPSYHTYDGMRLVTNNSRFTISHVDYDYTKLQSIICTWNTNQSNSVAAINVAIEDAVYKVNSNVVVSSITKDDANARIDLGFTNETGGMCILRYIMYKEIY